MDNTSSAGIAYNGTARNICTTAPIILPIATGDILSSILTMNLVIGCVGVVGQLYTIFIMVYHKPLRQKMVNYFFINQSLMDLLASFFLIMSNVAGTTLSPNFGSGWMTEVYCKLWTSKLLFQGFFLASLWTRAATVVERYLQIVHPIKHRLKMTKNKLLISIIVINVAGMAYKASFTIPSNIVRNGSCVKSSFPSAAAMKASGFSNACAEYFIPITIICFCYIKMAISLMKKTSSVIKPIKVKPKDDKSTQMSDPEEETDIKDSKFDGSKNNRENMATRNAGKLPENEAPRGESKQTIRARNNIIKTLFISVLLMTIFLSYKEFLLLFMNFGVINVNLNGLEFNISIVLSYVICSSDPFVYFFSYEEFQKGALKLIGRSPKSAT